MCLRSLVMAPVSFVGPLDNSMLDESFSDNWYLWLRPQHPSWTRHGVVHAPAASSWCKQCTVTLGLTTGFESLLKDQTGCLIKLADGKYFLCLSDAQSVGFLHVLRGEQWGNWHGGELLHEDDYSIFCNDSDACALMRRLSSLLCHASLTSRPPGNCTLILSTRKAPQRTISLFHSDDSSIWHSNAASRFGHVRTLACALLRAALRAALLCVASLMEGRDSALVFVHPVFLERVHVDFDVGMPHDGDLFLHFCNGNLQQQHEVDYTAATVASAPTGCTMLLIGLSVAQLIAMLLHSGFKIGFRLDEISGTNFAGDLPLKILSSPIVLESIALFRPHILACFETLFVIKLFHSCSVSCSSLTILEQNGQLWLIVVKNADNNIAAFFRPLEAGGVYLPTEHHFHNAVLLLARATCLQNLHLQSFQSLLAGITSHDDVRVWTVHIARWLATVDCLQMCNMALSPSACPKSRSRLHSYGVCRFCHCFLADKYGMLRCVLCACKLSYSGPTCACGDVEVETNPSNASVHLHSFLDCSVARPLHPFAALSATFAGRYLPPPLAPTRFAGRGGEGVKGAEAVRAIRETTVTSCVPHSTAEAVGIQAGAVKINESRSSWSDWSDMMNLKFNLKSSGSSDPGSKHYEGGSAAGSPARCGTIMVKRLCLRGGGPSNQTITFLIDGASNATIVNDITLLDPSSIVQVTESHNTAAQGAQIQTTAVGLMSRMWQLRDRRWVAFSMKASFAESIDVNVIAEHSLDSELSLVADKFEKQVLRPKGNADSDPSQEVPLTRSNNLFYVHTAALPVVNKEDSTSSRVNYTMDARKIGLLAPPSLGSAMLISSCSASKQLTDRVITSADGASDDDELIDGPAESNDSTVISKSKPMSLRTRPSSLTAASLLEQSSTALHEKPTGRTPSSRIMKVKPAGIVLSSWREQLSSTNTDGRLDVSDLPGASDKPATSGIATVDLASRKVSRRETSNLPTSNLPKWVYPTQPGADHPYFAQVSINNNKVTVGRFDSAVVAHTAVLAYLAANEHEAPKRALPKYVFNTTAGSKKPFYAQVSIHGKKITIGRFNTSAQAHQQAVEYLGSCQATRAATNTGAEGDARLDGRLAHDSEDDDRLDGRLADDPESDASYRSRSASASPVHDPAFERAAALLTIAGGDRSLLHGWSLSFTERVSQPADLLKGSFHSPDLADGTRKIRTKDFRTVLGYFKLELPVSWHLRMPSIPGDHHVTVLARIIHAALPVDSDPTVRVVNLPTKPQLCGQLATVNTRLAPADPSLCRITLCDTGLRLTVPNSAVGHVRPESITQARDDNVATVSLSAGLANASTADAVALAESLLDSSPAATELPRLLTAGGETSSTNSDSNSAIDTHIPVDLKRAIMTAGAFGSSTTLRVVRFNSGEQQPKGRIGARKPVGAATASDHLIRESSAIKEFLCNILGNRDLMWTWITSTPGIDVTAIFADKVVCGASLGLHYRPDNVYLTHMTAVRKELRTLGIGTFMRSLQTQSTGCPMILSLSANHSHSTDLGQSAVSAQTHMMESCGYLLHGSPSLGRQMITTLDDIYPSLHLSRTLDRGFVTPLLFVPNQTAATSSNVSSTILGDPTVECDEQDNFEHGLELLDVPDDDELDAILRGTP